MINIPLELYGLEEGKNHTDGESLEDERNQGGCNWWKTLSSYLCKDVFPKQMNLGCLNIQSKEQFKTRDFTKY